MWALFHGDIWLSHGNFFRFLLPDLHQKLTVGNGSSPSHSSNIDPVHYYFCTFIDISSIVDWHVDLVLKAKRVITYASRLSW
jgi:hypothetical protein